MDFEERNMGKTVMISLAQFVFTIIIWSTFFTESVILVLIKVVIFFFGCAGACIVQMYNNDDNNPTWTKMLPCGMLVMLILSLFADILIVLQIISKGFMNCFGEFVALAFGSMFTAIWVSLYYSTNDFVQLKYYDGNGESASAAPVRIARQETGVREIRRSDTIER